MNTIVNQFHPQEVCHPGEILEEKLQEMGVSIKEFSVRTRKPERTIIEVIKVMGKKISSWKISSITIFKKGKRMRLTHLQKRF